MVLFQWLTISRAKRSFLDHYVWINILEYASILENIGGVNKHLLGHMLDSWASHLKTEFAHLQLKWWLPLSSAGGQKASGPLQWDAGSMYFEERSSTSSLFSAYWHTSPGARDLFEHHNTRSQIPSRQACNHAIVGDIRLPVKRDHHEGYIWCWIGKSKIIFSIWGHTRKLDRHQS